MGKLSKHGEQISLIGVLFGCWFHVLTDSVPGFLDCRALLFLVSSFVAVLIYIPANSILRFPFFSTLTSTRLLFLDKRRPDRCEMISRRGLLCLYLMATDTKHLSYVFLLVEFLLLRIDSCATHTHTHWLSLCP